MLYWVRYPLSVLFIFFYFLSLDSFIGVSFFRDAQFYVCPDYLCLCEYVFRPFLPPVKLHTIQNLNILTHFRGNRNSPPFTFQFKLLSI